MQYLQGLATLASVWPLYMQLVAIMNIYTGKDVVWHT